MKDQFVKVAVITPEVQVADTEYNTKRIIHYMRQAQDAGVKLAVFPELCLTGYTCGDLFLQDTLLQGALNGLQKIQDASQNTDTITIVGLPFLYKNKLYNTAAIVFHGEVMALVPKTHIPNYSEFYEARYFSAAPSIGWEFIDTPYLKDADNEPSIGTIFGTNLLMTADNLSGFTLAVELCEDLWTATPPSGRHAKHGATVIANLSASDETTGKGAYRRSLVTGQSARLLAAYLYADAGEGESSTDLVFSGHNLIAENGTLLQESKPFTTGMTITEIDLGRLSSERRRITNFSEPEDSFHASYTTGASVTPYQTIHFQFRETVETKLTRQYGQTPFVPQDTKSRQERCEEILQIQAMGLKKRLAHTHSTSAVVGISGGLDSTLALLVTTMAFDMLHLDRKGITAVTMPCFGTTDRTYQNACSLVTHLGATLREIPIHETVTKHFCDIGHDPNVRDVTYENSQARYRTLVLMDIANTTNGLVIGTGDLSELALGWATYNGDHMSMYGVNASIPKTLVRHLVLYYADTTEDIALRSVLMDVLDTPVSPELLPPKDGEIAQKTEDLVGPYELHDFFLYYVMRFGYHPSKIFRLAVYTFAENYTAETILRWLRTFYKRFFTQQFKRSCLPDGPKVGSVTLSPRGDWRMPSDANMHLWMKELEEITC